MAVPVRGVVAVGPSHVVLPLLSPLSLMSSSLFSPLSLSRAGALGGSARRKVLKHVTPRHTQRPGSLWAVQSLGVSGLWCSGIQLVQDTFGRARTSAGFGRAEAKENSGLDT